MRIQDLHDYSPPESEAAKSFLSQHRRDAIVQETQRLVDGILTDEFDALEAHADEYISDVAADRAERFLMRVLQGDKNAAMALIGDKTGGDRRRIGGHADGKPWAEVLHGRLFETDGVRLRRQLVEACGDLIRNERIKDLEATVTGLMVQIDQLKGQLERNS